MKQISTFVHCPNFLQNKIADIVFFLQNPPAVFWDNVPKNQLFLMASLIHNMSMSFPNVQRCCAALHNYRQTNISTFQILVFSENTDNITGRGNIIARYIQPRSYLCEDSCGEKGRKSFYGSKSWTSKLFVLSENGKQLIQSIFCHSPNGG